MMITRQKQQPSPPASQAGFTIIESLLAILVVAILLVGIAPVLVLSAATRIQARRVEVATQSAKAYIDGLTSRSIPVPPNTITATDPSQGVASVQVLRRFADIPAPNSSGNLNLQAGQYGGGLYCIDNDGTGRCESSSITDVVVQAVRSTTSVTDNGNNGYLLSLRVYRADAFKETGRLNKSEPQKKATQTASGGNNFRTRIDPVVEMTAEINPANDRPTFSNYCKRYGCLN